MGAPPYFKPRRGEAAELCSLHVSGLCCAWSSGFPGKDGHSLPSLGPPSPRPRPARAGLCVPGPPNPPVHSLLTVPGPPEPTVAPGLLPLWRPSLSAQASGRAGLHGKSPLGVAPETPTHTTVCE